MAMVKMATVCMPSDPRDKSVNLHKMVSYVEQAAAQDVDLIVFPEEALTGVGTVSMQQYNGEDKEYIIKTAEFVPEGDSTQAFIELAKRHDIHVVWSMAERDEDRFDATYNTAVLVGPEGYIGKYRKVHLPLCERLIHYPGLGDYPVFDTRIGKIGLEICFDKCFPEVARTLALQGAQIIVNPICWPNVSGTLDDPDHKVHLIMGQARAMENMIFFIDANQCGPFMEGHSQIIGPNPGQILATTGFEEGMAVAEADIEQEIINARVHSMGGSDLLKDRKPGTYGELSKPNPFNPIHGGRIDCCCE